MSRGARIAGIGIALVVLLSLPLEARALGTSPLHEASQIFTRARAMPPGPGQAALYRDAAGRYEAALRASPSADEAPEAAINGAYAWKQVGEYRRALALYELLLAEYGRAEVVAKLDPRKRGERVRFLAEAADALGATYVAFFDYANAARAYDAMARREGLDEGRRRGAAHNATILHAKLHERDAMAASARIAMSLKGDAKANAATAYVVASYDHELWSATAPDEGDNRRARLAAEKSLAAFYDVHKSAAPAATTTFEAAYAIATMKRASPRDASRRIWLERAVAAYDAVRAAKPSDGDALVDRAAECALALVDPESASGVRDIAWAERGIAMLVRVLQAYPSQAAVVAAMTREGALYEATRARAGAQADERAVERYASAIAVARAHDVSDESSRRAARRLASYASTLGDAEMARMFRLTPDPTRPGELLVYVPGSYLAGIVPSASARAKAEPQAAAEPPG